MDYPKTFTRADRIQSRFPKGSDEYKALAKVKNLIADLASLDNGIKELKRRLGDK